MRRHVRRVAGFTLLPVILTMTLIAAIAFLLNRDNGMNTAMVSRQLDGDRARLAAEAGLQAANARVQSNSCAGGFPVSSTPVVNANFGGASYSAHATSSSGNTTGLVSTGTFNGTSVTLSRSNVYVYQTPPKTYTLQPGASTGLDTYIATNSSTNNGNSNSLQLSSTKFPLVKFDLSTIFPAGSRPVASTLSLYANGGFLAYTHLYRMTGDWQAGTGASSPVDGANWTTSNGVTPWATAGGDYYPVLITTVTGTPGSWLDFDTTDLTASWLTASGQSGSYPNYGVRFTPSTSIGALTFASSDNSDSIHRPKIVFNYLLPCGTTGPADPPSGTVTLSPTADSYNDSSLALVNNGAATVMKAFYTPAKENRILMQFDTSSIPVGVTVGSAKLRLYVGSVGNATGNTKSVWANALNEPWAEGTGNNTSKICPFTPTAGTSWNYSTNCTNWSFIHPPNTAQLWSTMASMPMARSGHVVATVNNKIYAIGGTTGSATLKVVEEYDPATNTWATKAAMPTARAYAAAAVVGGKIYVVGGTTNGSTTLKANEAFDPVANTWATKANMPTPRMYLAAAVANNLIYAIGGAKATSAGKDNEEYDPSANSWATKAQMPTARTWHSAQGVNGRIYVIGGYTGLFSLNNNEAYNPGANSWTTKTPMPTGTDSMGSAAVGKNIYLFSGVQSIFSTTAVWKYDTVNDAFTAQPNYPTATNLPAAAAVNNRLYSLGGNSGSTVFSSNYQYDPGIPVPVATAVDESNSNSPLASSFNGGWITFELKALVQEWVDGIRPNKGIVIYAEGADQFNINSRENSTNKPQLIVTY